MKRALLSFLLVSSLLISLTACAKPDNQVTQDTEEIEPSVSFSVSDTEAIVKSDNVGDYKIHEIVPITKDGDTYAYLTLNQSQKLGINDWTSAVAVDSGIKYSYTFNFKVKYEKELKNGQLLTMHILPEFVNSNNEVVGNPCIVGWSGFAETAVFDEDTYETYMEYGVQPLYKPTKKTKLLLKITDSNGNEYDDVVFASSVISKAIKGPSLITGDKSVKVTGASGAKIKLSVYDVYLEEMYDDKYSFTLESQLSDFEKVPVLGFKYKVNYLKAPTKKLEVSNIDTSTKAKLYSTDLKIGAQSNVDSAIYYDRNVKLSRFAWSDQLTLEQAVIDKRYKIHEGTYAYANENRQVTKAVLRSSESIRFRIEFSSDALSLSPEKLMKFKGRFIVFDKKIHKRRLYTMENSKKQYAIYTNDKNPL